MKFSTYNFIIYLLIFLSLFLVDYALGNGLFKISQRVFCKIACCIKRVIKEQEPIAGSDHPPVSIPILFIELGLLSLTIMYLNKIKKTKSKDRIDELLQESKDALEITNEFLEKWRLRRINWETPSECSYLDDEPQEIKPIRLEVPLLHMAIVDTLGTTRSQLERGDAGDTINFTDSTILSVSSLLDDDFESTTEVLDDTNFNYSFNNYYPYNYNNCNQQNNSFNYNQLNSSNSNEQNNLDNCNQQEQRYFDDNKNIECNNRYLWDVIEEDVNNLED